MRLELGPAAEAEVREAYQYYWKVDKSAAARFMVSLDETIARISRLPTMSPTYLFGTHRLLRRRFPFAVIYRVDVERIVVVAVAHQKRRPGYWRHRDPTP